MISARLIGGRHGDLENALLGKTTGRCSSPSPSSLMEEAMTCLQPLRQRCTCRASSWVRWCARRVVHWRRRTAKAFHERKHRTYHMRFRRCVHAYNVMAAVVLCCQIRKVHDCSRRTSAIAFRRILAKASFRRHMSCRRCIALSMRLNPRALSAPPKIGSGDTGNAVRLSSNGPIHVDIPSSAPFAVDASSIATEKRRILRTVVSGLSSL